VDASVPTDERRASRTSEIVWSWRPKGSALKLAMMLRITPMTVAIGKVHRGEHV
jgi:hypothetical protein